MKKIFQLIAIISAFAFIASCKKNYSVDTPPPVTYDADAKKFFDSSAITDTAQMSAINNFVKQLKDSSLWAKFSAIYPMIGGSANTMKWNLKNPANSDAAYRLTFNGSPTFSGTGVLFPTPADFANTHFYDSLLTYNDNSISYYSRTQNTVDGYDMGCVDNKIPYNEFAIYHSSDASAWFGFNKYGMVPAITKGLFMLSATASNAKRYENGVMTLMKGSAPVSGFTGMPILIGTVAASPSAGQRECALATIGQGFSDAEAQSFYNIVNIFESKLNR